MLAACGGEKNDADRAVDRFNGGLAPVLLHESMQRGGGVSFCRIGPQEGRPGFVVLTVVMNDDTWLQATIDPDTTLVIEDVTRGRDYAQTFDAQQRANIRDGEACTASPADGTLALD